MKSSTSVEDRLGRIGFEFDSDSRRMGTAHFTRAVPILAKMVMLAIHSHWVINPRPVCVA